MSDFAAAAGSRDQSRPGFGILLSLLAIGLLLTSLRGLVGIFQWPAADEAVPGERLEIGLGFVVGLACLVSLVLLLKRKRLFIPVMSAFFIVNILGGLVVFLLEIIGGAAAEEVGAAFVIVMVQIAISGLWLAYLLRSQRVREVCCE